MARRQKPSIPLWYDIIKIDFSVFSWCSVFNTLSNMSALIGMEVKTEKVEHCTNA